MWEVAVGSRASKVHQILLFYFKLLIASFMWKEVISSLSSLFDLTVRGLGLYLGLTGCKLGASDLLHTGLATHFVSSDRLLDLENELITSCPDSREADGSRTEAREVVGNILDRYHETNTTQPDEMRSVVKPHSEAIERCFAGKTSVDNILSALEAELAAPSDPASIEQSQKHDWIRSTVTTINKQPPSSLMLTLTLLALAEERLKLDLKRCLEAEYRAMMHCMRGKHPQHSAEPSAVISYLLTLPCLVMSCFVMSCHSIGVT